LEGLLRGNSQQRADYISKLIQNGVLSPNEARRIEGMNTYEGGNEYWIQANLQPVDSAKRNQEQLN
jgi:phage portal protein BeeE